MPFIASNLNKALKTVARSASLDTAEKAKDVRVYGWLLPPLATWKEMKKDRDEGRC
jgi:hypothetical protein